MHQTEKKRQAALKALDYIPGRRPAGGWHRLHRKLLHRRTAGYPQQDCNAVVSSSEASTERLKKHGFEVSELSETGDLDLYVDGADEANKMFHLIKGGGGALTREKIVAAASRKFVCIIDDSKMVGAHSANSRCLLK